VVVVVVVRLATAPNNTASGVVASLAG